MSISSSLYTGMSSLFALGEKLGTIGDNLANTNTTGFRANQVSFEDILFEATNTGGVRLSPAGIKSDFSKEGGAQSSNISTHMAISGDGFFILNDKDDPASTYYTRAGEFNFDSDNERIDAESYLVNPMGHRVQGYKFESDGTEDDSLTDIKLELTRTEVTYSIIIAGKETEVTYYEERLVSTPKASTRLTLKTNLDTDALDNSPGELYNAWDATEAEPMSSSAYELRSSQDIYDDAGATHTIELFFGKTSTANTWEYLITAPPAVPGAIKAEGVLDQGTLIFGSDGILASMTMAGDIRSNGYLAFPTASIPGFSGAANIELDMGINSPVDSWQPTSQASTQYGYGSYTIFSKADGYGEGEFTNFSVNSEGVIRAMFNNGVNSDLFRVGLANTNDPAGHFKRIGYSLYQTDLESITRDTPGNAGLGKIMGGSLESSNVDMAEQFGDLIFTQRAFQANSKSMVAADEMLKTLIALKR